MKKKMLMLLMILTLSVSLAACGTNKEASKSKQESETEVIESDAIESETIETESEAEQTDEPESETVEDTAENAADSEADEDIDIASVLGTFDGEKYVNEQFHMTITIPIGWEVMSDEEKYEILGFGADIMTDASSITDEQVEQALQSVLSLFLATDSETVTDGINGNIIIAAEKLTGVNKLVISTATNYLDISKAYLEEIEDMNGVPVNYELGDYENVTIGGIEWTLLPMVLDMNNGSIRYTQNLMVTLIDDYAIALTASYLSEAQEARISELIENISFE